MNTPDTAPFELRFRSLFGQGRGFAFPCDADGQVDLDRLSERGRRSYLLALALVGSELALPVVECTACRERQHAS